MGLLHPEGGFVAAKMCSKGTVSARDSFVYISEAVLSNHGAAPETQRPENMQCLTVSSAHFFHIIFAFFFAFFLVFFVALVLARAYGRVCRDG